MENANKAPLSIQMVTHAPVEITGCPKTKHRVAVKMVTIRKHKVLGRIQTHCFPDALVSSHIHFVLLRLGKFTK
jgi:hypothetical protein